MNNPDTKPEIVLSFEDRMKALGWNRVIFERENKNDTKGQEVFSAR